MGFEALLLLLLFAHTVNSIDRVPLFTAKRIGPILARTRDYERTKHSALEKHLLAPTSFLETEAQLRSMTVETLKDSMHALIRGRLREDPPGCGAETQKMCDPCPQGGNPTFCEDVKKECLDLYCHPLCKGTPQQSVWYKCTVKPPPSGPKPDNLINAICAEFMAGFCTKVKCCPEQDQTVFDWVEDFVFGDDFPNSFLPLSEPKKGEGDCNMKVEVEAIAKGDAACKDIAEADPKQEEDPDDPFSGKNFPGPAAHKGFKERCQTAFTTVDGQLAGYMKNFNDEKLPCCLGCEPKTKDCDCPVPVFEKMPPYLEDKEESADTK